ncbi:hypothetical protein DSM110093_03142 [Sulfitobacter sp. DSM 110093]|uniref:hypothetical protein n=1 Tax=Sulfitobacter sp. DSM 110093 TaxID=2883127 RepID=UPI001FAD3EF3|nr:hypothetical protein [Sulfitobacter sp. DSM 110093]UOA33317.1 hypothetical protein DSM110093_03142 [Sulfitobacter sp. DSM 110093]
MTNKTDRLIEALKASARQDGEKDAETRAKIRAAMIKSLETLLREMPEQRAAELFADIEELASASAAKLIRRHELRPEATDHMIATRLKADALPSQKIG